MFNGKIKEGKLTEGTKSVLFGCHNPIMHGLAVLRAWKLEYNSWPEWWQIIGIFLHDIGVWGREYLSDDNAKIGHWELGANLTFFLVFFLVFILAKNLPCRRMAHKARDFVAGHCPEESGYPPSLLMRADKRSWLVAPLWWMKWNYWLEGFKGFTPILWRQLVRENLKLEKPIGNHELYIKHRIK